MSLIASAIVYGLIALAIGGTLYGAYEHVVDKGRNEVRVKYAPMIDFCKKQKLTPEQCGNQWQQAMTENGKWKLSYDALGKQAKECSDKVDLMGKTSQAQLNNKNNQLAKEKAKNDELETDKRLALQYASIARPVGETCEQTLGKIDTRLRDLATRELRDRSAEAIRNSTPSPAPTEGARPGALRIK